MFHDRRQRDRERLCDVADGHAVLLGEPRQDRAARRIGQSRERGVQFVMLIVNHMVKYRSAIGSVKENNSRVGRERTVAVNVALTAR
jgi:hypothetical protein